MKPASRFLAVFGPFLLAGPLLAQNPSKLYYSGSASGSIRIFNDSKIITESGRQNNTVLLEGRPSFSHTVAVAGSAVEQRIGGGATYPFSMRIAGQARGYVSFGHLHFSGRSEVATDGQHFTNSSPSEPQTAYGTEEAQAGAYLSMGYNDRFHVESPTLPPGTPVVVRASLHAYASAPEVTSTSAVLVNYPPTGPGFPATSAYELVTTRTAGTPFLQGQARLTALKPGVTFPFVDDKFLYPLADSPHTVNVNAEVGGTITVNHGSEFSTGAATAGGKYAATAQGSSSYNLYISPVTEGVSLRSESGHQYAPLTGQAALMQVYSAPDSLVLTAPAGAIFQKLVTTAGGFDWQDLTESQMLVVPLEGTRGFYRVRQP